MVSMDQGSVENLSIKQRAKKFGSMDWRSCWECVEQEPRNLDGSRSYQDSIDKKPKKLDGSRICRDAIEKAKSTGKFLKGSRICRGSIEKKEKRLNRKVICWESVEKLSSLKKRSFSREEKHIKMNVTSKLSTKHPSDILRSQNISQHIAKHTWIQKHTHTK